MTRVGRWLLGTLAVVVALAWSFPIYWMVSSAFLPTNKLQTPTPTFFPLHGTLSNFRRVLAVGGSWGTLSEVAIARRTGVPVVCVDGWSVSDVDGRRLELEIADTAAAGVRRLLVLMAEAVTG